MENAFGLIYTGDASMQLRELTYSRSVAAVPFGGRYRTIDFMLSNLVNSGIYNVGVIAQKNYHSLMDHLESGKEWDLHRRRFKRSMACFLLLVSNCSMNHSMVS